jgi:hypothetical protein
MGMTIEELIEEEQYSVNIHKKIIDNCCAITEDMSLEEMELVDERKSNNQGYVNYHNQIIDILRKYQKIEEIYKNWCYPTYFNATDAMNKLGEVLKDGNDD